MLALLLSLLFSPETVPFAVALGLMCVIGLLEGIAVAFGTGLSGVIDGMLPDLDVDMDVDVDVPNASVLNKALSWLHVGRVPVLILLVVFLTYFGLTGLFLQHGMKNLAGSMMPAWLAVGPALALSLPMVRASGAVLAKILPKDETDAVSRESFVGRVATLGAASATTGHPSQAKLYDQHGQAHYVLIEPDLAGEILEAGSEALLIRQAGARFFAIRNPNAALGKAK